MEQKSICNNLQETFYREDDEEDILQTFLESKENHMRNSFCFQSIFVNQNMTEFLVIQYHLLEIEKKIISPTKNPTSFQQSL